MRPVALNRPGVAYTGDVNKGRIFVNKGRKLAYDPYAYGGVRGRTGAYGGVQRFAGA